MSISPNNTNKLTFFYSKSLYRNLLTGSFIVIFIIQFSSLTAQDQRKPTGLILDQAETYTAIPKAPEVDGSKYKIPSAKNLKTYCPEPGNQGNTGACVAWALDHAALTICRAIRDRVTDRCAITEEVYSAAYLFNHTKEGSDCQVGSRFSKAFDFLKNKGVCLARDFNPPQDDCTYLPDAPYDDAHISRIRDYARIFDEGDSKEEKIKRLKMAIGTDNPVIIGMDISLSFYALKTSLWQPNPKEKTDSHHAMVVIGYDDDLQQVEIMNSYGLNWGNQGFFTLSYEDFARLVRYGFQIVVDDKALISADNSIWSLFDWFTWGSANPEKLGQGEIYFDYGISVDSFQSTTLLFDSLNHVFQTSQDWSLGDFFQLRFNTHQHYVYVFSYDPEENATRWEYTYDDSLKLDKSIIRIPEDGNSYEITSQGDNYLCLLYSKNKLSFTENNYLEKIEQYKGNIYQRILATFDIKEETLETVSYFSNLRFTYNKETSEADIIPVIIKFSSEN